MSYGVRQPRDFSVEGLHAASRLGLNKIMGNIFYVDAFAGDNAYSGLSPDDPFLTIAHALDQCVADHDDYIIVMDCWQQETYPIEVDVSRVHILGVDNWNGFLPRMAPPTDTPIFNIANSYIEIGHLCLSGGDGHGAIEITSSLARARIHDCQFGIPAAGQDGIVFDVAADATEVMIDHNTFYGAGVVRDPIRIEASATRAMIRNNIFRQIAGVGINVLDEAHLNDILDNRFSLAADVKGGAISFVNAASVDCMVDHNSACFGKTKMAQNPYIDDGGNDWGCNFAQCIIEAVNTFCNCVMPATS